MAREYGLDFEELASAFIAESGTPYVLVQVPVDRAQGLAAELEVAIRRCYVSDASIEARHQELSVAKDELVKAKVPDRGSVMAGDFGEIITALFQITEVHPQEILDPKKWRLKQDRTKPAPHSDVVQFILPEWPQPSQSDRLICAEVKTKSTAGASTPVASAIADSKKDQEGRLAKTLVWFRERALHDNLGTVSIEHLERFINAIDGPPSTREFRAVAVICASLVDEETRDIELPPSDECALLVISIPNLKENYEAAYDAVAASFGDGASN